MIPSSFLKDYLGCYIKNGPWDQTEKLWAAVQIDDCAWTEVIEL